MGGWVGGLVGWLVGWLVGALSPVSQEGLYQGWSLHDRMIQENYNIIIATERVIGQAVSLQVLQAFSL